MSASRFIATRLTSTILFTAIIACGGGGAVVDPGPGETTPPGETAPPLAPPGATNAVVTTPNLTFAPRTLTVTPGTTVTWRFSDARHNVIFGALKPSGGDVPDTEPGGTAARTFSTAGTFDYQCSRHSGMTGQVLVTAGGSPTSGPQNPPPQNPPPVSGTIVQVTASAFTPERVEIVPGGSVTWEFSGGANGIVFEDDAPPGGNIPQTAQGSRVSRTFPAAGDYDYHSLADPRVKGRVRVR